MGDSRNYSVAGLAVIAVCGNCAVANGGFYMNMQPKFNYDSLRSQKARFSVRFGNAWHVVVIAIGIMMVVLGVWMLIEH